MGRKPDFIEARRAHRIEDITIDPRLANYTGDRAVEKDPWRVADDYLLGGMIERVTPGEVAQRCSLGQQRVDARVVIESVVVGAPLFFREQHVEEIRRVGKVRLPSEEESFGGIGLANGLEQ